MNKLKKLIGILAILIIIILLAISVILYINKNNNEKQNITNIPIVEESKNNNIPEHTEVTNPHSYFTVKACINKYLGYLYNKDTESIYRILDDKYIEQFKISQDNVLEFVEDISNYCNIVIKEMYVINEGQEEREYYVSGNLELVKMDQREILEEKYIITVKLDTDQMIYSIIPYGYGGPLYEKQ